MINEVEVAEGIANCIISNILNRRGGENLQINNKPNNGRIKSFAKINKVTGFNFNR